MKLHKIKIISAFYNPGRFLDDCIGSLLTQDYENYEILFIDDCSTDGSSEKIPSVVFKKDENGNPIVDKDGRGIIENTHPLLKNTKCKNITLWQSGNRRTALENIHNGIMKFCTDVDDLVVLCDGDDRLLHKQSLSNLNQFYNENDCWMSWGSCFWSDGSKDFSSQYPEEEFKNLRKAPFRVSHLRSFFAGLYSAIRFQDTDYSCLKDKNGNFYKSCYDVPMIIPMLEMAGFEKSKHNSNKLYFYNRDNPISDDKVDQKLQSGIHREVLTKKPFKRISDFRTGDLLV